MAKEVIVTADKIKRRKKAMLTTKIILLILLFLLFTIFIVLYFVFTVNRFTITLDNDFRREKGITIYNDMEERVYQHRLYADSITNMDNICIQTLPKDIHTAAAGGSHNGENYIAYTFFIENQGSVAVNYWYEIDIDDSIKGVDEAVRVVVFRNDEETVYAKKNKDNGQAERDLERENLYYSTTNATFETFYTDDVVTLKERTGFEVGDIDKFTIVIFLEGDDPDCIDEILGGEVMMHMEIREEHLDRE